ncbi:TetR family transcriptional regulator [Aeromicrobium sp. PE09-221]|uniref:TetR/AcrR family transcriptional regulator n=1 Tax=Aeromicrobium sp. PE09-221 TaxID=1898043 RepID=UPI000B3EDF2F|nr:TetR family transcriptional regulator C-terminal domain-containing protein [Aeromicrobium sp. PE09-221]OUZ10646.1 TetR family transcriptional regulator [Aeromicrobium sp. PE09-221]
MRQRLSPTERRAQIVEAAHALIVQEGLAATSLRDIAAAAGVSMGTVTYHFAGVDEILGAVVVTEADRFYEGVVAAADNEPEPRVALDLLVAAIFDESPRVEAHWRIWSEYWTVATRRPELAEPYAARIRHWEQCCTRVIARGVESGTFRTVEPAEAALKLAAYSDGLGTQRAQGVPELDAATARSWMTEFVRLLLEPIGR